MICIYFSNGVSVLHCAVGNGHQDIVEHLLRAKARVNIRGVNSGRTPLFVAAEVGNLEILNMLIKAGARVNIPNDYGKFHHVCQIKLKNGVAQALITFIYIGLTPQIDWHYSLVWIFHCYKVIFIKF